MPIAAIPSYLGRDFQGASPGMRFGMYLPIWTERSDQEAEIRKRAAANSPKGRELAQKLAHQGMEATLQELLSDRRNPLAGLWEKNEFAAKDAWAKITQLTPRDKELAGALCARQAQMAIGMSPATLLGMHAVATAPFSTGLGNEHPLENGFAFLNPYGIPYLPGSGVKGVLRQAARELVSGEWGPTQGWSDACITTLFGLESLDGSSEQLRGVLSFWDVIPQVVGNQLAVEIMTPHQSHYYQEKCDGKSGNSMSPHDSGQPTPITFLSIPPGSAFAFYVQCDLTRLALLAPELARDGHWQNLLKAAFAHAFAWLGFGAKTATGYGAMQEDTKRQATASKAAQEAAEKAKAAAQRQAYLNTLSPLERVVQVLLDARTDKNVPELSALRVELRNDRWSGSDKIAVAKILKTRMQAEKKWKEQSTKKNPAKDSDYQDTLLVMNWIAGK